MVHIALSVVPTVTASRENLTYHILYIYKYDIIYIYIRYHILYIIYFLLYSIFCMFFILYILYFVYYMVYIFYHIQYKLYFIFQILYVIYYINIYVYTCKHLMPCHFARVFHSAIQTRDSSMLPTLLSPFECPPALNESLCAGLGLRQWKGL